VFKSYGDSNLFADLSPRPRRFRKHVSRYICGWVLSCVLWCTCVFYLSTVDALFLHDYDNLSILLYKKIFTFEIHRIIDVFSLKSELNTSIIL
jgi:hypothetical protein